MYRGTIHSGGNLDVDSVSSVALFEGWTSPWGAPLYNVATDTFVASVGGEILQWVGMEALWSDLLNGSPSNATTLGVTALVVEAFSAAQMVRPLLGCLVIMGLAASFM